MLRQPFRLGRIFGIPVGVDLSWFIVFLLITFSLSTYFSAIHPDWSQTATLVFGVVTSLLFFGSVLLHELGHSVVALYYKIPVKSITLFIFGGVAQIMREPERPGQEFNIAAAGPIVSAVLGISFYSVSVLAPAAWEGVVTQAEWLGRINLLLAVFNLIPGFPLDGGRVFRAVLWKMSGSYDRATRRAVQSGQFVAYGFIALGLMIVLSGNLLGGVWIGFIGWFLLNAARSASVQARFQSVLAGLKARNIMASDWVEASGAMSVSELVENHFLTQGVRCCMVVDDDGRLRGLITLHEIKRAPRDEWPGTSLQAVMVPASALAAVTPDTDADSVMQVMRDQDIAQVPVVEDGKLVGVIGRDRMLTLLQTHLELKS